MTDGKARLRGLWRNPHFVRLWTGQTISIFGSFIGNTALLFLAILVLNATPVQMAWLVAATRIPGFLVGLVAGVWVDRLRRRPILIGADLGRAILLGSIPAAALLGLLRIEHLYVVAFLVGILTVFFDVAYQSYLPSLVRREELIAGNSALEASASVAEVGGFGLAGWLVQWLTAPIAILVDALSFVWSAAFVGWIRAPEPAPARRSGRPGVRDEVAEGLRVVLGHPLLRAIAGGTITRDFSLGVFGTVFSLYALRGLGFQPGIVGMIYAVGGVSSLLGALLAGRVAERLGTGLAMVLGMLVMGLSMFFVPLAQGAGFLALCLMVAQQLMGDGAYTVYQINQVSLRQTIAPGWLLGRVNASIRFGELGATLIGTLAGGLLGQGLGLRPALAVGAGGTVLAGVWLALSPVRTLKKPSAEAAERLT